MQTFSDNLSTLSYESRRRIPLWLYNAKEKTILLRSPKRWALTFLFYLIYYICLSGFFAGMMSVFIYTQLSYKEPMRSGAHSLLKLNPGMSFRPMLNVRNTVIKVSTSSPESYLRYITAIDTFLREYKDANDKDSDQFSDCSAGKKNPPDIDKVCKFGLQQLGPCGTQDDYGYKSGKPCVLAKINKMYGWLPDIEDKTKSNNVLVNCTGQNPADVENIAKVNYFPAATYNGVKYGVFSSSYFPYLNQVGYLSPLVGIQVEPKTTGVAILVKCQLFNLKNWNRDDMNFELLVD